jgi:Rps23 Pro-64 3,4-dihydroxylase Tpa1-like proline 4-hydroxylase
VIVNAIQSVFDEVIKNLGIPVFSVEEIEAEITAHNHGDFYKAHTDDGPPSVASRILTYVYYFQYQLKAFTGGSLKIYDTQDFMGSPVKGGRAVTIEPYHNSIVFFPSYFIHEVLPIECPSREFLDSRFTVNGWLRKAR